MDEVTDHREYRLTKYKHEKNNRPFFSFLRSENTCVKEKRKWW